MTGLKFGVALVAFVILAASDAGRTSGAPQTTAIVSARDASALEVLASREIRRYGYLRTGRLLPIVPALPQRGEAIVVQTDRSTLKPQQYQLKTSSVDGRRVLNITGGDPVGALYGAYRLAERLGVRFYLHGDVVPDRQVPWKLPELNETGKPLFPLRGIQPFHDFPEGPDWWNADDYKAILSQLAKLRMNFIGLHTYPEGHVGPEPLVWIGLAEDIGPDATVRFSYPARHFTTANVTGAWGYRPQKTAEYAFGAAMLYDRDDFGADYMRGMNPWTAQSPERSGELFRRTGLLLADVLTHARRLGIKTCLGTETPLTIPQPLQERLKSMGKDPQNPAVVQQVYEGIFRRIMATHPLDYYWLWTPEGWTWRAVSQQQIDATIEDLTRAIAALEKTRAPFTLATCGWVLGPQQDRALFDRMLPKAVPLSCINRNVGFSPVEIGFARIAGRPQWAIPWMEDDPAITAAQLWAGRMRRDAADALAYGCSGLMGIHWRTRILGPNVSALAHAAWQQQPWNPAFGKPHPLPGPQPAAVQPKPPRDLPVEDFYADWALSQFGPQAAEPLARLFAQLDGGPPAEARSGRKANLPRPATWVHGPGGVRPDPRPWQQVQAEYRFVDQLEALRPRIQGPGNLERFDYWLNQFRYLRAVGQLRCLWGRFNAAMKQVQAETDPEQQKQRARLAALPLRRQMARQLAEVQRYLLASVTTWGGFGNVTNWQQHVMPMMLDDPAKPLEKILGQTSEVQLKLPKTYAGPARLIVPTLRSQASKGERLTLKVIVLANRPPAEAALWWRSMGEGQYQRIDLQHVARAVYRAALPPAEGLAIEYYIQAKTPDGTSLIWPPTAPAINQTVVVTP